MSRSRPGRAKSHRSVARGVCASVLACALVLPVSPATGGPVVSAQTADDDRPWTIMYYGSADNDLEMALLSDVREMTQAGFGGDVEIYVLLDRSAETWEDPFGELDDGPLGALGDFSGAKVFRIVGTEFVESIDLGEIDSSDPDTLAWFVSEVMRVAPARNTALIMSDHGAGAYAFGVDDDSDGAGGTGLMTARDVAAGLTAGLAPSGRRLDLLALDACLMANLEFASWLQPTARLLLASEDLVPGYGFDYRSFSALTDDPTLEPLDVAQTVVDAYADQYGTSETPATTLSILDLDSVRRIETAVASLSGALLDHEYYTGFLQVAAESRSMAPLDNNYGFLDLGDVSRRLAQPGHPDSIRIAADAVFGSVEAAVVSSWEGLGRANTTGLSISVPFSDELFPADDYAALGLPEWGMWIDTLFASSPGRATGGLWDTLVPDFDLLSADGLVVSAQLEQAAVDEFGLVSAEGVFGQPSPNGGMGVLLAYDAITDSGEVGTVSAAWTYQVVQLRAGTVTALPTTRLFLSTGVALGWIDGRYRLADGTTVPAELDFSIDPESGEPTGISLYTLNADAAWSQTTPQPGSTFLPLREVISPDGLSIEVGTVGALSFDDGISVELVTFEAGDPVAAGLAATDGGGGRSVTFGFAEVPV